MLHADDRDQRPRRLVSNPAMSLPYEGATSGERGLNDLQKILTRFGCQRFGTMTDNALGELIVQFNYRGREVIVKANFKGYAAAWLKENPYSYRMRVSREEHENRAMAQAQISVCSIVRDWVKGQITAIEVGMLTFEGAFLGNLLLGNGRTVMQELERTDILRLDSPK